jgi:hypothetical protein
LKAPLFFGFPFPSEYLVHPPNYFFFPTFIYIYIYIYICRRHILFYIPPALSFHTRKGCRYSIGHKMYNRRGKVFEKAIQLQNINWQKETKKEEKTTEKKKTLPRKSWKELLSNQVCFYGYSQFTITQQSAINRCPTTLSLM